MFVDSAGRRVEARGRVGDNVLQLARECGVPIEGTGGAGGVPIGGYGVRGSYRSAVMGVWGSHRRVRRGGVGFL